ncbi:putative pentatricopeptide repeat-containing protein At3g49142 [Cryptomeria japonica]|uniref:putative pentatricopeptide repeat-containing protein At3g49142 n=1 Tax=Cryptomeria japonica TaxID=3369 RepID=UPI0027DAA321|nr:putative pentatricopeptide repeat-containing protein At3g49142 [Cryptomeria japonica]
MVAALLNGCYAHFQRCNYNYTMSMTFTANLNFSTLYRERLLIEVLQAPILLTTRNSSVHCFKYLQLSHTHITINPQIRSLISCRGFVFAKRTFFQNNLVNMYVKCGELVDARKVFDDMKERDGFSWNAILAAYRRHGFPHEALALFHQMQRTDVQPDQFAFASILPACAKIGALDQGLDIHRSIMERGIVPDLVVENALVDMYAKCGSIHRAREVFDKMPEKNVVSWNAMISGYAQNGVINEALRLFKEMPEPDVISWSAIVAGYAQNGFFEKALDAFKQMQLAGLKPNSTTFVSILSACSKWADLEQGMVIHQSIIKSGLLSSVQVANALIDMYAKCASLHKARELFDKMMHRDVVSWTAMIAGYAQNCVLDQALRLFKEMPRPDVVSWNAMVAGYAQNGFVEKALEAFTQMQLAGLKPNPTTFASILPACATMGGLELGYAQNGLVEKAVETFKQMQLAGVKPASTTFASILPACAKLGSLEHGMDIHRSVIESGFWSHVIIANALIDMYAKCGSIHKARELFDKFSQKDVISWNAMVAGYAQNGLCKDSLEVFELMKNSGTCPNHVSFACVLYACSHAGLVDEGCKYFIGMSDSYCIMPTIDHYVCMADLLGRAGYLEETLKFIIKMPIIPVVVVWACLLGACRSHNKIRLGVFTATLLFELDPKNAATYVLLSNIYADVGRWVEVHMVRKLMQDREVKKVPGCSWIEDHKMIHVFSVGDRSHPQTQEIYEELEKLSWRMKLAGYFPDSKHVLNDVEEEEKELFLCHHSEKLAIAFGLLNTPPGTTIRVVKNLRVCVECHTATKFISKILARQIVVRDGNRFHHFEQGQCSCGDYW